jgi:hypothetical protein
MAIYRTCKFSGALEIEEPTPPYGFSINQVIKPLWDLSPENSISR